MPRFRAFTCSHPRPSPFGKPYYQAREKHHTRDKRTLRLGGGAVCVYMFQTTVRSPKECKHVTFGSYTAHHDHDYGQGRMRSLSHRQEYRKGQEHSPQGTLEPQAACRVRQRPAVPETGQAAFRMQRMQGFREMPSGEVRLHRGHGPQGLPRDACRVEERRKPLGGRAFQAQPTDFQRREERAVAAPHHRVRQGCGTRLGEDDVQVRQQRPREREEAQPAPGRMQEAPREAEATQDRGEGQGMPQGQDIRRLEGVHWKPSRHGDRGDRQRGRADRREDR